MVHSHRPCSLALQKFKIRVQGEESEDDPPAAAPSKALLGQEA